MAYAEDCKSFYTGSIPVPASKKDKKVLDFMSYLKYLSSRCRFWRSSAVELSAVNRSVVGSNPTARANKKALLFGRVFLFPKCRTIILFRFVLPTNIPNATFCHIN